MDAWWLGILLGIGVIGLHAALRILAHLFAFRMSDHRTFVFLELGGLAGRMMVVFGAVALVLLFVPVHPVAFVATVLLLLILSMGGETYFFARQPDRGTLES